MGNSMIFHARRPMAKPAGTALLCAFAAAALTGCASGGGDTGSIGMVALPGFGIAAAGRPVDVYVMLARQAKACWMTAPAPLASGYQFAADVSPEGKGGGATITIFEKNAVPGIKGARGLSAYAMSLTASGEGTSIAVENARVSEGFAKKMHSDVERWAAGETGCNEGVKWPAQAAAGDAVQPAAKAPARKEPPVIKIVPTPAKK